MVQGLRLRDSAGTGTDCGGIVDDNAYHHWALVCNGAGSVEVWRDAGSLGTKAFSGNISMTHVGAGNTRQTNSFFGQIDELYVYDGAISAAKVNELYAARVVDPGPPISRVRVILLSGQPDADGRATPSALPTTPVNLQQPQNDADLFYKIEGGSANLTTLRPGPSETSQFGLEITLGRAVAAAVPRASLINTDTCGMNGDNLHFNAAGQQALGNDAADALVSFVPLTCPPVL